MSFAGRSERFTRPGRARTRCRPRATEPPILRKEREWQEREADEQIASVPAAEQPEFETLIRDYTKGLVAKEREAVQSHDYSDRISLFDKLPGRHGVVNAGASGMKL